MAGGRWPRRPGSGPLPWACGGGRAAVRTPSAECRQAGGAPSLRAGPDSARARLSGRLGFRQQWETLLLTLVVPSRWKGLRSHLTRGVTDPQRPVLL